MATLQKTTIGLKFATGTTSDMRSLTEEQCRGMIFLNTEEQRLYGDTSPAAQGGDLNPLSNDVREITWNDDSRILTITYLNGTKATINLSSSDMAEAISALQSRVSALESADTANKGRLTALEEKVGSSVVNTVTGNLVTGNGKNASVNLFVSYNKYNKTICFYNQDSVIDDDLIATLDATDFVKDGMLNTAELVEATVESPVNGKTSGYFLKLTFNTDSGITEPMYIDVSALIDIYTADGQGLILQDKQFSLKLVSDGLLKKDSSGLAVDKTALVSWLLSNAVTSLNNKKGGLELVGEAKQLGSNVFTKFVTIESISESQLEIQVKPVNIIAAALKDSKMTVEGADVNVTTDDEGTGDATVSINATPKWYTVTP